MAKKAPAKAAAQDTVLKQHTAALLEHSKALRENSQLLKQTLSTPSTAVPGFKNHAAAMIIASKPQKTFNEKTADASDCMSAWLISAKGVSAANSRDPTKNMSTDFHIGSPAEMQLCLEAVQACMAGKGDAYHLDTTSANANAHLLKLLNSTLGVVIADIVSSTT
jgi:hypothetical protein